MTTERAAIAEQLASLAKLRADGVLSEEEFEKAKARLLEIDAPNIAGRTSPEIGSSSSSEETNAAAPPGSPTPQPRHVTLGFIAGWAWAIFAGVPGLMMLFEGKVGAGIFVVLSALIALPLANDFLQKQGKVTLSGWVRIISIVGCMLVAGLLLEGADKGAPTDGAGNTSSSAEESQAKPSAPQLPDEEAKFISAISTAMQAYNAAPNDMAKGGTRADRRTAICNALQGSGTAENWVGTIKSLSSNSDGKGVLEITIAPDLTIGTWNNAISDIEDSTLLDQSSGVFKAASQMKEGDAVWFSGSFISSDADCVKEESLTLEGSMQEPAFLMRFTAINSQPPTLESTASEQPSASSQTNDNSAPETARATQTEAQPGSSDNETPPQASFDCAKATEEAEITVCNTPELISLDEEYSAKYIAVRSRLSSEDPSSFYPIRDAARAFLRRRNACGSEVQCISEEYRRMIDYLSGLIPAASP